MFVFARSRIVLAFISALLYGAATALANSHGERWFVWPPSGLALAVLMATRPRSWWLIFAAGASAHLLALWSENITSWRVLGLFLDTFVVSIAAALVLRRALAGNDPFGSLRAFAIYVLVAVIAAPALAALSSIETVTALFTGEGATLSIWRGAMLAHASALLTLTPACYVWLRKGSEPLRRPQLRTCIEIGVVALALYLACSLATAPAAVESRTPLVLLLPPLLWAAARFGVPGAATSVCFVAIVLGAAAGRSNTLLGAPAFLGMPDLHLSLATIALTALVVSIVVDERARSARALVHSEERYRAIVECHTDLICRNLPDTTLTFVNGAYCRFFGKSTDQLIGRKWIELLPHASWEDVRRRLTRLSPACPVIIHEHEVLLPDGRVGWQHWVDIGTFDSEGRLVEVQGIGRDITELKDVERSLRERDERFRLVLQATHEVIFDWDIANDSIWFSADEGWLPAARAPRYTCAERVAGIHLEDRARYCAELNAAIEGAAETWQAEYRYGHRGGPVRHVRERAYIMRDAGGAAIRVIGSLSDLTDRKRLAEAHQVLAHLAPLVTLGEITASISHEINQPLGAILNNVETALLLLANRSDHDQELREILEDIRRDDQRASDVVRRLAAVLRGEQERREAIDLDELVNDAASLLRAELRRRRIQLEMNCESHTQVAGDRGRLQQVLLNLLLNAADALEHTTESQRRIIVRAALNTRGHAQVDVIDTGCGVPDDRLESIFDSFVTTKPSGMGLGLSISRAIVAAHNGRIWARNNLDRRGATFSIELAPYGEPADGAQLPRWRGRPPPGEMTGGTSFRTQPAGRQSQKLRRAPRGQ